MRVLIATPYLPWPLIEGGRVAQYRTLEAIGGSCAFTMVVPVHSPAEENDAREFARIFPNVKVKPVRSFQTISSPSVRTRARNFAGKISRTIFPPRSLKQSEKKAERFPDYPFYCLGSNFVAAVEENISNGCDIFQAEFADMLTLGPLVAGRVPSIFVHHQLHFVYARRFMEANQGSTGAGARYVTERIIREEPAYLNTFNSAIVFSETDQKSLKEICPCLEINVSPFPSPEDAILTAAPFEEPANHFVFVASGSHRPNVDGLIWFMKNVWPAVKKALPDARIEVVGKWSPSAQISLPNHGDIEFSGFVPDLAKSLQHKIMVVPLWVGSGIRTKILAAWSASCPVITTTVGVEGLPGQTGEHFVVADDAPSFANSCIELSQDAGRLNRIAANGLALVQTHYSLEAVRKTRLEVYEKLLAAHWQSKP